MSLMNCDELRNNLMNTKAARNRALTENANAENEGRSQPHSDLDLSHLRSSVELAAGAARAAGCDIDDLVGPNVGLPKEPPPSELATDRCRDVGMVLGPTPGTIITWAMKPGFVLRAVRAVQSREPHGLLFVGGELVDVNATMAMGERGMFGFWVTDALERPSIVAAVDGVATAYSNVASAASVGLNVSETDDGAEEALQCSRNVRVV